MKILNMSQSLKILSKYSERMELYPTPNSFPNGAPAPSNKCYIIVNIPDGKKITESDANTLKANGWFPEDDGWSWLIGE